MGSEGNRKYQPPQIMDIGDLVELTAEPAEGGALGKCGIDADGQSGLDGNDHSCSLL